MPRLVYIRKWLRIAAKVLPPPCHSTSLSLSMDLPCSRSLTQSALNYFESSIASRELHIYRRAKKRKRVRARSENELILKVVRSSPLVGHPFHVCVCVCVCVMSGEGGVFALGMSFRF